MDIMILPSVNAGLNTLSACLLVLGYILVRRRALTAHKAAMLGACMTSILFLISYLYYHAHHGSTPFQGQGIIRTVYFSILISHTVLAAVIVPLAVTTVIRGLKGNFEKHKRIARITFPIWLYVSVTGVIVYVMLYRLSFS